MIQVNSKIKKIFLVRHGHYDHGEGFNLSDLGKEQISNLSLKLFLQVNNLETVIIASKANRASQSADILQSSWEKKGKDVQLSTHYELWSGTDAYEKQRNLFVEGIKVSTYDIDWLVKYIMNTEAEALIIVTHPEFIEHVPPLLGFRYMEMSKGECRIFDMENKRELSLH